MRILVIACFILVGVAAGVETAEKIYCREYEVREGLPNFFIKAESGQKVRIAYFGGSITAQNGYRTQSIDCFRQIWNRADFEEINAAIPATGSELGVFRTARDVIRHNPDLVFVEFAAADYDDAKANENRVLCSIEGIVRQIKTANPQTDICFLYTITAEMAEQMQKGIFPQSVLAYEKVAQYYGLPSVNMGFSVFLLEKAGRLVMVGQGGSEDNIGYNPVDAMPMNKNWQIIFSPDGVLPYTDSGHIIYTQAIKKSFEKLSEIGQPGIYTLKPPINPDNFEKAKLLDVSDFAKGEGWYDYQWNDTILPDSARKFMPSMIYTCLLDDSVEFRFAGRAFGIFDVMGPKSGNIVCMIDDKEAAIISRFDKNCGHYRLSSFLVYLEDDAPHNVKMILYEELPLERKAEIISQNNTIMQDTDMYDDHCWHIGNILLIGDIIEPQRDEMGRIIAGGQ